MAIMQYNIISFAVPEIGNHVRTYEFSRHTFDWPDVTTRVENIGRNIVFQRNHLSGEFAPGNGLRFVVTNFFYGCREIVETRNDPGNIVRTARALPGGQVYFSRLQKNDLGLPRSRTCRKF